ncbi:DUF1659 domain-containing protein [Sporomusa malonica]|uniref:DUF1659 domain-containing protein n=1 Tax=Sporomusa malonica TaxID=112901 RepID=A0A1W1Z8D1_9FIRM|nr:DUF1659 domain-containing protein [Sporomusa malonica]SMC44675.1 Protein of unknown function [Sporomusa malonica]
MAVVKVPQLGSFTVKVQTGISGTGNPVYANRTFGNLKSNATEQNVFDVAQALADLQKHTVTDVALTERCNLINQ